MTTARAYAGAALLAGVLCAVPAPVSAAASSVTAVPQLGTLFVDPPTGADDTPLDLLTSGGCPAPATNVVARAFGNGFPAGGQIVVGNTDAGVRRGSAFSVVPGDTLRAFAALQPTPGVLSGSYRVVVSCQEALGSVSLGDYVGTLVFSSPRSYTARNPAVRPVPAPADAAPLPTGAPGAAQVPGAADGTAAAAPGAVPGSGADTAAAAAGGTPTTKASATASASVGDDGSLLPLAAAGLGGFGLAGVLLGASRLRRRLSRHPRPRTAVT
ncbi:MAG: hypothetical protein Q8R60_12575 [Mycobacteriales bacterium]|nr:hypothetical protein [Mycobacteriales bacterium]